MPARTLNPPPLSANSLQDDSCRAITPLLNTDPEQGAALLITVLVLAVVAAVIAGMTMEVTENNTVTAAQTANYNEARTAALVGIAGMKDFLNTVQTSKNTATASSSHCGNNGLCSIVNTLTNVFWGNSNDEVVPPNGGLGAIGYFNGQQVSIKDVSLSNQKPYIKATVSLHIIGNTYKIGMPATNNSAAQPPEPGLITVVSQGISGQASATAEAVLGPISPLTPGASNTTLSLAGTSTVGKIINQSQPSQHTFLQAQSLNRTSRSAPEGFTSLQIGTAPQQVSISANTLESQANIIFIPPQNGQTYPRIELENIQGNNELNNGQNYRLSNKAMSRGVCTSRFFGCISRVSIFAPGTSISYSNGTWTLSNSNGSKNPALLIPGAAYFPGNVTLDSGLYDNAIISTGNIDDNATVYAPNYAGPTSVCGNSFTGNSNQVLFPTNFCGPQGTQFIPGSIGNIALYADGTTTIGDHASVYGDILSRGDLTTDNLTEYGFIEAEGSTNTLSGTTTINNESAPESFNPTPLDANQYSATEPSTTQEGVNEPIGLLGLTWIN